MKIKNTVIVDLLIKLGFEEHEDGDWYITLGDDASGTTSKYVAVAETDFCWGIESVFIYEVEVDEDYDTEIMSGEGIDLTSFILMNYK